MLLDWLKYPVLTNLLSWLGFFFDSIKFLFCIFTWNIYKKQYCWFIYQQAKILSKISISKMIMVISLKVKTWDPLNSMSQL